MPTHQQAAERFVTTWAVGVTTAPRTEPTLHRTLPSLAAAGWPRPRLFAEPGVDLPAEFADLPISRHDVRLGAFPNWYLGLAELVMREPRAEAYFLCQDDVLFAANLRDYLEHSLWPAPRLGVVSAYAPSHYTRGKGAGFHVEDRGWRTWGALAYLFPNPSARALLCDPLVVNHRHHGPADGLRNIDSVVGQWCQRRGLPYYIHMPSLAQHIGETSTLFPHATNEGRRRAVDYVEDINEGILGNFTEI